MVSSKWTINCTLLFILLFRGQRRPYCRAGSESAWNEGCGGYGSGFFWSTVLRCCSYYQLWDCGFSKEVPYFSWLLTTNDSPPLFSTHFSLSGLSVSPSLFTILMSPLCSCVLSVSWHTMVSAIGLATIVFDKWECSSSGYDSPPLLWDWLLLSASSHWLSFSTVNLAHLL